MMKYLFLVLGLAFLFVCSHRIDHNASGKYVTGTIKYLEFEGGFYGIVADDSTYYQPLNLPDNYKKDGMRVRFRFEPRDVPTFQMWGVTVEILKIEKE